MMEPSRIMLGDMRQRFVIDEQTSAEPPGSERLLDAPPLRKEGKTFGEVRAADDLDGHMQARQRPLEAPGIGAVGGREDKPRKQRSDLVDQIDAAIAVLQGAVGDALGARAPP
jgi:hypothetical protein